MGMVTSTGLVLNRELLNEWSVLTAHRPGPQTRSLWGSYEAGANLRLNESWPHSPGPTLALKEPGEEAFFLISLHGPYFLTPGGTSAGQTHLCSWGTGFAQPPPPVCPSPTLPSPSMLDCLVFHSLSSGGQQGSFPGRNKQCTEHNNHQNTSHSNQKNKWGFLQSVL